MELLLSPPTPKQRLFLTDTHRYVAFGGARGGGKSYAVRLKAVLLCCGHPGITVLIVRKTYPELISNHIEPLCALLRTGSEREELRCAKYSETRKTLTFPNGSRILFRYCDTPSDADRFQGLECDVLFIDEATQQPEDIFWRLNACVRGVNNYPRRTYLTCNPGGVGHAWVKRLFLDRQYRPGENPEDFSFIRSLVTDNTYLLSADPGYVKSLEALPPKVRAAWLEGRWDVCEGQFFEDFVNAPGEDPYLYNHVIPPFPLDRGEAAGWTVFRSYDFGYARPFSCAWWAVDYDGTLYRVLELYGCTGTPDEGTRLTPDEQFAEIARLEREHPWLRGRSITGVADPSIWDASRGISVAETAARHGIFFTPGDNRRIPGWMQCHRRLRFDAHGRPGMYVFSTCEAFLRTVPLLTYAPGGEDLDSSREDHAADEWRYACMSRPLPPERPAPALSPHRSPF